MTTAETNPVAAPAAGGLKAAVYERLLDAALLMRSKKGRAGLAGLAAVAATVAALTFAPKPGEPHVEKPAVVEIKPEEVLAKLDERDFAETRRLASRMLRHDPKNEHLLAISAFARGASAAYEAEEILEPTRRRRRFLLAARFLEEAQERGMPKDRTAEGLGLLGRSLVAAERFVAARVALRGALQATPQSRDSDLARLYADALRNEPDPDLREALRVNGLFLGEKTLSEEARSAGLLQRAEILIELGDMRACAVAIAQIPDTSRDAAAAAVLTGRLLLDEARQLWDERASDTLFEARAMAAVKIRSAIDAFRVAQLRDRLGDRPARQAMYLVGVCLQRLGDYRGAAEQFSRTQKLYSESAEGFLSLLAFGDAVMKLGDRETAIATYAEAVASAMHPEIFPNPWLSRDEFRDKVMALFHSMIQADEFEAAIGLADKMPPMIDPAHAAQLSAETHVRWAQHLQQKIATQPANTDALNRQSAEQYRLAGAMYAKLAELRFTTNHYTQDIWQAAVNALAGQSYDEAIRLFRRFLDNEARLGRPQALVNIGEAHLARGRVSAARKVLQECLDIYPRDAACYRARILAAKALLREEHVDEARALLEVNLEGELTPASAEWRDSIFMMGEVEYAQGMRDENAAQDLENKGEAAKSIARLEAATQSFRRAADTYEEGVQRFPQAEQTTRARYQWAEALRRVAKLPRRKMRDANIEAVRLVLVKEIQVAIHASMVVYEDLQNDLNRRLESRALSPLEGVLLRNCYFVQGDLHYELGEYEQAIVDYKAASNRYQSQPETLYAYFQIASCYRRLNKASEARGALEQARVVLGRITADDKAFVEATSQTRAEWDRLLTWMATL